MTKTAQIIDFNAYAKRREETQPAEAETVAQGAYFWYPVWVMVPQQGYAPLPQVAQNF
ncbi:MAG: hypothetical protein J0L97_03665 [Alphaproteobacteria bacterium]|nr:hypothetical protein [Alphaproteobacteria bacterium]